jgi:hypothetical protein
MYRVIVHQFQPCPHLPFPFLQEWQETLGLGLAGAGSELERQMAALQQNLGEAAGEVGSGIAGAGRRLSLLIV